MNLRSESRLARASLLMGILSMLFLLALWTLLTLQPAIVQSDPFQQRTVPFPILLISFLQMIGIPLAVIGCGLGGVALIRVQGGSKAARLGVVLNGSYLFFLTMSLVLALAGGSVP
jgi:hypothetical protein